MYELHISVSPVLHLDQLFFAIFLQGNNGLKPKDNDFTSKPWHWPINYQVGPAARAPSRKWRQEKMTGTEWARGVGVQEKASPGTGCPEMGLCFLPRCQLSSQRVHGESIHCEPPLQASLSVKGVWSSSQLRISWEQDPQGVFCSTGLALLRGQ